MNNLHELVTLITNPGSALMTLRERPRFWFPLLTILLLSAGLIYWYYSAVDIEWLKQQLYANMPQFQQMADEQRTKVLSVVTRNTLLWGGMAGAVVMIALLFVFQAVYLLVAGKVTGVGHTFKQWFALTCWTALPATLLSSLISALMILLSNDVSQLAPGALKPLTLNELFFHLPIGQPGQSLLAAFDLLSLWTLGLLVLAVHLWSRRSWFFSTVFALLPTVLIYGVWSWLAFK